MVIVREALLSYVVHKGSEGIVRNLRHVPIALGKLGLERVKGADEISTIEKLPAGC